MNCIKCGYKNGEEDNYCENCGAEINHNIVEENSNEKQSEPKKKHNPVLITFLVILIVITLPILIFMLVALSEGVTYCTNPCYPDVCY